MKTFDFITSMSKAYYEKSGFRLIETFLKHFPQQYVLHVWTEDYPELPKHERIIQHNLNTNKFYNQFTLNVKKIKGRAKTSRMSIKVGVQYEASQILKGDVLVWLDADVYVTNPVNSVFFEIAEPKELANYMGQHYNNGPETGFISYNRHHHDFNNFMNRFVEVYYSDKIYDLEPAVDTSAWWDVYKTMPKEYFYSVTRNSPLSHVFHVSELRHWLGHAKGGIKNRDPETIDKRAFHVIPREKIAHNLK